MAVDPPVPIHFTPVVSTKCNEWRSSRQSRLAYPHMVSTGGPEQDHKRRSTIRLRLRCPTRDTRKLRFDYPGNRCTAFHLLHKLSSDPNGQEEIHTFFKDLEEKGHTSLDREGHIVIRRVINNTDEDSVGAFQRWIHQLTTQTSDHTSKRRVTVTTQNLGPIGISLSMDVVDDTLALGPYVSCMQDVLLHGQNLRSVKRSITGLNPNYQIFPDIAQHATDDIRKRNYAGWVSSGMTCLTMLHKDIFNIPLCRKYE